MNTWFLNPATWDLVLDSTGSIALASDPYSLAQDAASAIKTFLGEVYYDTTQGVPYFEQILGYPASIPTLVSLFQAAALTVPEVTSATVFITSVSNRAVTGQVQISTATGQTAIASF